MAQIEQSSERGLARCLVSGCDFVHRDAGGSGIAAAERHADQTGHGPVEVEIDALLVVYPDSDDSEDDDTEEDADDDVQWVGTGTCENCYREDVDLCVWAGMTICSDCLVLGQSGSLA